MALIEQSVVVDENDTIIAYKSRDELTTDDIMRTAIVWLEDGKGNVLIHKRSMTKSAFPSRWENAAGGGVAHDETYEQAAYKELEEEIGVTGIKLTYVDKTLVHTDKGKRMCSWFSGICDWPLNKFILEAGQVDEVKWVKKEELFDSRDKNPDNFMPSSAFWRELFGD